MTTHGRSRYLNDGCRCDVCREAQAAYSADLRARRAQAPDGAGPPHGTVTRYNGWVCRCQLCREAHNANAREKRKKRLAGRSADTVARAANDYAAATIEALRGVVPQLDPALTAYLASKPSAEDVGELADLLAELHRLIGEQRHRVLAYLAPPTPPV